MFLEGKRKEENNVFGLREEKERVAIVLDN